MDEQEVQEKIVLYQLLQNRLNELKDQSKIIQNQYMEIETTLQALEDLKKTKDDNETLFSIGSGCYSFGKLILRDKLLLNLGAGVVIEKSVLDALKILQNKKTELEKLSVLLNNEMAQVLVKMNEIAMDIEKMQHDSATYNNPTHNHS